ncbi:ABC transporter ATP-binding protein/permease [bacterium]|nr:ABC transporter ATP-binding protein/permease [bacterium]
MGFGRGPGGHGHGRGHGGGPHGKRHPGDKSENDPPPLKITDRRMLAWFGKIIGPRWPIVAVAVLAMVIGAVLDTPVQAYLLRYLIDKGFLLRWPAAIVWSMGMIGLMFLGTNAMNAIRMNLMHVLGQRLLYETRVDTYRHLTELSLSYFHRNKTGDIMSRLSNDVNSVEDMVVHGTDEVISDGLRVLLSVGTMFAMNWHLALLSLIPLPVFLGAMYVFSRFVRPIYGKIREELGEINAQLEERIAGILVIKAFARERYEFDNFEGASRQYYEANVRAIRMWANFFPALSFITSVGMLLVMWRGGLMLSAGEKAATTGTIMSFVNLLQGFYWRFGGLVRVYDLYNRALAALARIFQVLEEKPEVEDKPDAAELQEVRGQVDLEGVTFRYQTGDIVLKDVNVSAKPGETIALVGRSGAGKTSLVNLIPRFYDPLEGIVRVDGVDVREVTQGSLRSHMAMVLQETFLFNGSVSENVRYGRLDATDEEVQAACVAAHADEFIQDLPEKYDTEIGERGVKLSGGQKQRLAIARALLADPRILILDEATSLVDTEAEQIIQKALENLMRQRTTFVIAHRLSTVRQADKIIVIDDGAVVEEADHETLMQRQGLYAEMVERQFRIAEDWGLQAGEGMIGPGG